MNLFHLKPLLRRSPREDNISYSRIIVNVLLALAAGYLPWSRSLAVITNTSCQIQFSTNDDSVFVPVTVHGKSRSFIVATSSTFDVFDTRLKRYLGHAVDSTEAQTGSGSIALQLFDEPEFCIGPFKSQSGAVAEIYDFTSASETAGHEIWGVLGMQFLEHYALALDFDRSLITLSKDKRVSGSYKYTARLLHDPNGPPVSIECLLPSGGTAFLINTLDNSAGSIEHRLFDTLLKRHKLELLAKDTPFRVGAVVEERRGRLKSFQLGPFIHHNLVFSEADESALGFAYLRRYNILFDFNNMKIYMSPSKYFNEPPLSDRTGMGFILRGGKCIIIEADQPSAAASAGVLANDELLEIDGRKVASMSLHQVRVAFVDPQKKSWRIKVRRDSREREFVIVPQPPERQP